jgi:hypothetical protein
MDPPWSKLVLIPCKKMKNAEYYIRRLNHGIETKKMNPHITRGIESTK